MHESASSKFPTFRPVHCPKMVALQEDALINRTQISLEERQLYTGSNKGYAKQAEQHDSTTPCTHLRVQAWLDENGNPALWGCSSCSRRFYPACTICVDTGHREVVHPGGPSTPPPLALP